ncbi:MAG: FAD-dependent oxidoreductase [Planctomycetes bacterium]|nr:FAD-dependent oxidoreductase [Planctomycetota bacterium]
MVESMEFRFHGRGGQGGVTCAKIVAAAYASLGKSVQTFGDYAAERSGAPVRAYTRVADQPIVNRNKVYEPHHIVVLDHHLLGAAVFAGVRGGGTVLINTPEPAEVYATQHPELTIGTVDATAIARKHGIGSRTVVIVNTTIAGAFARLHGLSLDLLRETYERLGFLSNFDAAREAFEAVVVRPVLGAARSAPAHDGRPAAALPPVEALTEHVVSAPTGLQTGTWGTQRPQYLEKLAPCNAFCPAGNDVVEFIQSLHNDQTGQAATILGRTTPLAGVCGRVCPAPCMEGCNRREYDGSVNIRGLERWVADTTAVAWAKPTPDPKPERIAIVGGGPAGLSAAYQLARAGHRPAIFDGEAELGGVLRTGIPAYRLPRDVLDAEISGIVDLGVDVHCGAFLDRDALAKLSDDYDAVILATGLQKLRDIEAPGNDLRGIEQGIAFLHRQNMQGGVHTSGHVVVLGGGNTAMDCARTALRAGAERVTVAYRRTRKEMPAIPEEIDEALQEGVVLLERVAPAGFTGSGDVDGIDLAEVEMGPPDDSGRRRPVVTDRIVHLDCDYVLLALGQSADTSLLPETWELRGEQLFRRDDTPLNVFAAGDLATGDGTVTHALGSGRRAAGLALRALGHDVQVFERPDRRTAVPATDIRVDHFARRKPEHGTTLSSDDRLHHFDEVHAGLLDSGEAHRCFSCGHCTRCDTCLVYCPEGIIRREAPGYEVDYTYCKGCGICVEECPRRAMEMIES